MYSFYWSIFLEWLYISFFIWKAQCLSDEGICRSSSLSFIFLAGIDASNELCHKRMISEFPSTDSFWHIETLEDTATPLGAKIKTPWENSESCREWQHEKNLQKKNHQTKANKIRKGFIHRYALFSVKATSQSFGGWGCTLASGPRRWLGRRWKKPPDESLGEFSFYFKHQCYVEPSYWIIFFWLFEFHKGWVGQTFSVRNQAVVGWMSYSCLWMWKVNYLQNYSTEYILSKPQTPFQMCGHVYVIAQSLAIENNHSLWDNITRGTLSELLYNPFQCLQCSHHRIG